MDFISDSFPAGAGGQEEVVLSDQVRDRQLPPQRAVLQSLIDRSGLKGPMPHTRRKEDT